MEMVTIMTLFIFQRLLLLQKFGLVVHMAILMYSAETATYVAVIHLDLVYVVSCKSSLAYLSVRTGPLEYKARAKATQILGLVIPE